MNYEVRFGGQVVKGELVNYAVAAEIKKPFLGPAFDQEKKMVLADLHRKMDKLLASAAKLR